MSKYKTDEPSRKAFLELLKWHKRRMGVTCIDDDTMQKELDDYFQEKDIAVYNTRVLHGANTRNESTELALALGSALVGILLAGIGIYIWG